ncbi:hypothetical protein EVAR_96445_1 [Eumeta japonica]|uniref:Uncharacterized protein n=1 Tax=Eumeta variegata TaxID=151549 RepID=A0A4C1VUX2_EUMVA|nr:hypothetical protein EVAR_96445_1 [Eumeta japonica]
MEKLMKKLTGRSSGKEAPTSLTRSEYSLVSCTELTPGAIELWTELPDEVKNDPYLSNFRKMYENEQGECSLIRAWRNKSEKCEQASHPNGSVFI